MDHNMDGMLEEDELLKAVWASRPEAIGHGWWMETT